MVREVLHTELLKRLKEKRRFLQVVAGPRQVGKTTLARQVMAAYEVDFVLQLGKKLVAIEVKSGARRQTLPGMGAFARRFKPTRQLLVGGQGISLGEFLTKPAAYWL
jgi:predicted AAA+ superfamily ATPase